MPDDTDFEKTYRDAAMELLSRYVPFQKGDAAFNEVCRDFGGSGTTCGFLCHWLMWRLGVRDPKIVNWTDPAAGLKYTPGMNIAKIYRGGASPWQHMQVGLTPERGDIVLVTNGPPATEHVFIFETTETDADGKVFWHTFDAGQLDPSGKYVAASRRRRELKGDVLGDRKVAGWIPLMGLTFEAPTVLDGPSRQDV